jgi:hypothetical protein
MFECGEVVMWHGGFKAKDKKLNQDVFDEHKWADIANVKRDGCCRNASVSELNIHYVSSDSA